MCIPAIQFPAYTEWKQRLQESVRDHWQVGTALCVVAVAVTILWGKTALLFYASTLLVACYKYPSFLKELKNFDLNAVSLLIVSCVSPFFGPVGMCVGAFISCSALCVQEWRLYKIRINFEAGLTKLDALEKKFDERVLERKNLIAETNKKNEQAKLFWDEIQKGAASINEQKAAFDKVEQHLRDTTAAFDEMIKGHETVLQQKGTLDTLQTNVESLKNEYQQLNQKILEAVSLNQTVTQHIQSALRGQAGQ